MARSWAELERDIKQRMKSAMMVMQLRAETIMQEELFGFYAGGSPKRYQRTGQLGNSWRTTGVSDGGDTVSFKAYLDVGSTSYHVPNPLFDFDGQGALTGYSPYSHFTSQEVFDAAEGGYAHVVGRPGFWARSEQRFEKELNNVMAQYFS